jgi:hypothetical protein
LHKVGILAKLLALFFVPEALAWMPNRLAS